MTPSPPTSKKRQKQLRFMTGIALVAIFAIICREYFVLIARPEAPIRGDIVQYASYAWNLVNHGVFSSSPPQPTPPVPDSFRAPGYPWLLSLCMRLAGDSGAWYEIALQLNVLMGALTCLLLPLAVRTWLGDARALTAGFMLAFWPHHIAATGALLTEIAFGLTLVLAALAAHTSAPTLSICRALALGIALGFASYVNPVVTLLPPILAGILFSLTARRASVLLLLGFAIVTTPWTLRNINIPANGSSTTSRALVNLVQGSWPEYHDAVIYSRRDPVAQQIATQIADEEAAMATDPMVGVSHIFNRLENAPAYYLQWYLWEKPLLLWDWDIKLGAGGIHFHRYLGTTPLESHFLLKWLSPIYKRLNPWILSLAVAGAASLLLASLLHRRPDFTAMFSATLFVYLTVIHTILQAEPRYSIAYRTFQISLALGLIGSVLREIRARSHTMQLTKPPDNAVSKNDTLRQ